MTEFRDLANRLNRSDLVVGMHDADQARVWTYRFGNRLRLDNTMLITVHDRQLASQFLAKIRGLKRCRMLDRGGDHVTTRFSAGQHDSLDRHVARFGSTTGKNDFIGVTSQHPGNFCSGVLDCFSRRPAETVRA